MLQIVGLKHDSTSSSKENMKRQEYSERSTYLWWVPILKHCRRLWICAWSSERYLKSFSLRFANITHCISSYYALKDSLHWRVNQLRETAVLGHAQLNDISQHSYCTGICAKYIRSAAYTVVCYVCETTYDSRSPLEAEGHCQNKLSPSFSHLNTGQKFWAVEMRGKKPWRLWWRLKLWCATD